MQRNDTVDGVRTDKFSGLAWIVGGLEADVNITLHLPCSCLYAGVTVVSYAVQEGDTLTTIADLLSSDASAIKDMNSMVMNANFLSPGWVLFVPMGIRGSLQTSSGKGIKTRCCSSSSVIYLHGHLQTSSILEAKADKLRYIAVKQPCLLL